ncbi:probable imidazolonepropionase isoform X2 [Eurytemora carolleeae]|nr:probable imidazolonepropionase isoform X2 [Eurytemora carolleeae]|eukprot:XP_023345291.1 probable imidazolonepropionase isoform X2 [Eurytemora affinis]
MNNIQKETGVLSVAVDDDGMIAECGKQEKVLAAYPETCFTSVIDAQGGSVLPGLVDGHTHPVWAGDRVHEFALKLSGASYMEVHQAGGGINFTVEKTRASSEQELLKLLIPRLERMLKSGTTTVECKSGYGLEVDTEIKMLKVLELARREVPIEISSTFCGAHSVPKGKSAAEATADVVENQLKAVLSANKSGELNVENIDVFCEKGVFEIEDSRTIMMAGQREGLRLNFHGDELYPLGGAELGAKLGAQAISHLEEISDEGIKAMAESGSVAVILPSTAYILRLKPPPVRKMIEDGVIVALGTDFNPNAHCLSMPVIMHLACVNLRMSMNEALAAATINAAHSIGRGATHGSIQVGKVGDLLILNEKKWEHLVYQLGDNSAVQFVVKKGNIVYTKI